MIRTAIYLKREITLWMFWFRARWYNPYLAVLVIIAVILGTFMYWDMYISPDSPFGVVRRTVRYLETDPEVGDRLYCVFFFFLFLLVSSKRRSVATP